MKKILFIIIIFGYCLFIKSNIYSRTLEQITVQLNPGEVGITFLINDNVKGILLHHQSENELLMIEIMDQFQFRKEFPVFHNLSFNHIFVLSEFEKSKIKGKNIQVLDNELLNGLKLKNRNDMVEITFEELTFCIVTDEHANLQFCDFIYLSNSDVYIHSSEKAKLIIYDTSISNQTRLNHYNQWIDTLIIPENNYMTFIWNREGYEAVMIPK